MSGLRRLWHRVRRRNAYGGFKVVGAMQDVPDAPGALIYLVGTPPSAKWVVLQCPCRGRHLVHANLMQASNPHWTLMISGGSLSLKPSLDVTDCPFRSHFWIVRNQVRWADARSRVGRFRN